MTEQDQEGIDLHAGEVGDQVDADLREERLRKYFELRLDSAQEEREQLKRELEFKSEALTFNHNGN